MNARHVPDDGLQRLLQRLAAQVEAAETPLDAVVLQERAALAAALFSLRSARGLSQAELGQLSGVEQADISRIERAQIDPRTSTLLRLVAGLDAQLTVELNGQSDDLDWQVADGGDRVSHRATQRAVEQPQHRRELEAG